MSVDFDRLIAAARTAAANAYCPHSGYRVGAALLGGDDHVYTGCNIENASLGLTICAERVAVFQAVAAGARSFQALALVAGTPASVGTPCGACRQVLAEFCGPDFPVYCAAADGSSGFRTTLGALLPMGFTLKTGE